MDNGKYVNYYIDTMTQTMNEFLSQSISLKANSKLIEEALNEQVALNEKLKSELENANSLLEQGESAFTERQSEEIGSLYYQLDVVQEQKSEIEKSLTDFKNEVNRLQIENQNIRNEHDAIFSQAQHVETFRNELVRARNENDELRKNIDLLTNQCRDDIQSVKDSYESKIKSLKDKIKKLETPEPVKITKPEMKTPAPKEKQTVKPTKAFKDGGTF